MTLRHLSIPSSSDGARRQVDSKCKRCSGAETPRALTAAGGGSQKGHGAELAGRSVSLAAPRGGGGGAAAGRSGRPPQAGWMAASSTATQTAMRWPPGAPAVSQGGTVRSNDSDRGTLYISISGTRQARQGRRGTKVRLGGTRMEVFAHLKGWHATVRGVGSP